MADLPGPPAAEKWAVNRTTIIGGSPSANFIGGDAILYSPSVISSMAANRFSRIEVAVFPKALHSTLALFGILAGCAFLFWVSLSPTVSPEDIELKTGREFIPAPPGAVEDQADQLKLTIRVDNRSSKPSFDEIIRFTFITRQAAGS